MEKQAKVSWHASTSSGGTLSLSLRHEGKLTKRQKELELAHGLGQCVRFMEEKGYIPATARLMSSRDVAEEFGKSRQYWEKLLNEGKILYKETSAGRITTDLWVEGYLGNREKVDGYVKNVREVLRRIAATARPHGSVVCPACDRQKFRFAVNANGNTNGVCDNCHLHVHTTT